MGAADIIPGVSGGTLAYMLGIYERLIAAIAKVDLRFVRHLLTLQWGRAYQHMDGSFVLLVGAGIISAILLLTKVVSLPGLIEDYPMRSAAVFFGLMIGAIIMLLRTHPPRSTLQALLLLLAAYAGYTLVYLVPTGWPNSPEILFLCGMIAIMAMLLPGVSGSFLLLALGKYTVILNAVADAEFAVLLPFIAGALTGIILGAKLINALLTRYHDSAVQVIHGLVMGSVVVLWPYEGRYRSGTFLVPGEAELALYGIGAALIALGFWNLASRR